MIKKGLRLGSLTFLLLLSTGALSPAQNEGLARRGERAVHLRAEFVLVPVQVVNKKMNRPVGGLVKEDFVVFEDGAPQLVSYFGHEEIPLSVLLLIETYHRLEDWHYNEIFQGVQQILSRLRPEDEVALMGFNGEPQLVQEFTTDRDRILQGLRHLEERDYPAEGELYIGGLLYTASIEAIRYTLEATERGRRRALIAFTYNIGEGLPPRLFEGEPEVARRRRLEREELERKLLDALYKSDTVVCGVIIGYSRMRFVWGLMVRNEAKVDKLVKITSGRMISAKPGKPVRADQLVQLIDVLQAQYVLGYIPTHAARDGRVRKIKVALSSSAEKKYKGVRLRHRTGYILPALKEGGSKRDEDVTAVKSYL